MNRKNPNIETYIGTKPAEGACDNVSSMSADSMSNANDNVEMSLETTSVNKSGFRMMTLNTFSLMPHLDELRIFVSEKKPHIIGITDTKIDSSIDNSDIEIDDYVVVRNDRNKYGGGVATYIHKYRGKSIIIKGTEQMGVNRLNSVQKATNLKKNQRWE